MPTGIGWTDETWNPTRGCSILTRGCYHCYAMRVAWRFSGPGMPYEGLVKMTASGPKWNGRVRVVEAMMDLPKRWRRPRMVFVGSMSDLFHPGIADQDITRILGVIRTCPRHRFQILTKRPARMASLASRAPKAFAYFPRNAWVGVSIENQTTLYRVDDLRRVDAAVRWLSIEPLVGPLRTLALAGIHWVVVGGESGPGATALKEKWVIPIRDACVEAGVPFFFKQWGGRTPNAGGRMLGGRTWDQFPHHQQ